ncbi:MAG TPA: hypothetical protein VNE16_01365 [Vicinamibacterales bacterium]|nr:hypothetical protein [Vicinamibacterales bacterium]
MPDGEARVHHYRADVLDALGRHGVRPTPTTDPRLVFEYVNDLYRYEIRRLRDQLRGGTFPRTEYARRIVELRRRYPLVSRRLEQWTEIRNEP